MQKKTLPEIIQHINPLAEATPLIAEDEPAELSMDQSGWMRRVKTFREFIPPKSHKP